MTKAALYQFLGGLDIFLLLIYEIQYNNYYQQCNNIVTMIVLEQKYLHNQFCSFDVIHRYISFLFGEATEV